jgi:hypothetical protein
MNQRFAAAISVIPQLFHRLSTSDYFTAKGIAVQKGKVGVYAFFENDTAAHVGRTRNLQGRLGGHITQSHFSASYAFKRAPRELDIAATYVTKGSRAELVKDPDFRDCFHRHIEVVRAMNVRFIEVTDPVQQYLLELYAHLEYRLPLDEFDTH